MVKLLMVMMGIFTLCLAVGIGFADSKSGDGNYLTPMIIVVIYLLAFVILVTILKYRSSYPMRMSQFLLAVYCRAENNRLYLKKGVEIRPGFLGKWIEFTCFDNAQVDEIIQQMRQRFLKPCLEQKSAIFEKEIMNQPDLIKEQRDIEN